MSTVGRIFLVLNLLFAGAFLVFAGSFLKNQDKYKTMHLEVSEELETANSTIAQMQQDHADIVSGLDRTKTAIQTEKTVIERQLEQANAEKTRLSQQLSELEGNYKRMEASTATIAQKVDGAFRQAKEAWDLALQSQKDKDDAINNRDEARADLLAANNRIESLERDKQGLLASEASLGQTIREQEIIIAAAEAKGFTGLDVQPAMDGIVTQAQGDLVTVRVTKNDSGAPIKKGYKFAIYNNNQYKGDMTVTDVADNYAIGRIYLKQENASIQVGDSASTDLQVVSAR